MISPWIFAICAVILFILSKTVFKEQLHQLRLLSFSYLYTMNTVEYNKRLTSFKNEHFAQLKSMTPRSTRLKGSSEIRILEIGLGPGINFDYYPKAKLIVVEPNTYFKRAWKKKLEDYPHITLEKSIVGEAEDLNEIQSESIDVVVVTNVLCSVNNVSKALKEIKRVLVPGGKYYFCEHVGDLPYTWLYKIQRFINAIYWKKWNYCDLGADTGAEIERAGFSTVECNIIRLDTSSTIVHWGQLKLLSPNIIGVAVK